MDKTHWYALRWTPPNQESLLTPQDLCSVLFDITVTKVVCGQEYTDVAGHHYHLVFYDESYNKDVFTNFLYSKFDITGRPGNKVFSCTTIRKTLESAINYAVDDGLFYVSPPMQDIFDSVYIQGSGKGYNVRFSVLMEKDITVREFTKEFLDLRLEFNLPINTARMYEYILTWQARRNPNLRKSIVQNLVSRYNKDHGVSSSGEMETYSDDGYSTDTTDTNYHVQKALKN